MKHKSVLKHGPTYRRLMDDHSSTHFMEGQVFPLGRLVITRGALDALERGDVIRALSRHARGDWGEVDEHDLRVNETALQCGYRLVSIYQSEVSKTRFYVITEEGRSVTTVLLPEEY